MIICTVGCLMMLTVASMPVAQKSSLDHLIIPYEDSPVDYGVFVSDQGSQFKDEPTVSQSNGYFLVNIIWRWRDCRTNYSLYYLLPRKGHHHLQRRHVQARWFPHGATWSFVHGRRTRSPESFEKRHRHRNKALLSNQYRRISARNCLVISLLMKTKS